MARGVTKPRNREPKGLLLHVFRRSRRSDISIVCATPTKRSAVVGGLMLAMRSGE